MANKILTTVWDNAPSRGITATDLLVLLRIADSASEETGIGWESVPTIAAKIGSSERTVQRCLRRLEEWDVIEDVPEPEWPAASRRYRSVPRRIRPVDEWSATAPNSMGDNLSPLTESHPDELVSVTPVSPNPSYVTSSTQSSLDTSYQDSPSTDVPVRRKTQGWDSVPPAKVRGKRKRKTTADDRDPSDVTRLLDEGPQPEPEVDLEAGRQRVAQKRATRSVGPAEKLARSFGTIATQSGVSGVPGETNIGALGKAFADWRRNGTPDEVIRQMIEVYWSEAFAPRRAKDKAFWVDFLAQRGRLFADGQRLSLEAARAAHAEDADFWTTHSEGSQDDAKYDPANWSLPADLADDSKYDAENWT